MGNKLKFLPTEKEEKNCSTSLLQHSTLIDIWNICAAELYLFDSNSSSSLVMEILDISNGHWRIIWTHIHVYSLVIMFEYGWVPADKDSYRFMSEVKPLSFQRSWDQTLFQNSDTIPELRYCSRLVDVKRWAKMLGLLLLLLLLQRSQPQSVARNSILHSQ